MKVDGGHGWGEKYDNHRDHVHVSFGHVGIALPPYDWEMQGE